jgi:Flp pilus assembly pilin Flp
MRKLIRNRNRKGQGLVEYALIIAGVTLIAAVGISLFGHKVSDMIDAVAVVLPGAHTGDNGPIQSGHLLETTDAANGPITLDLPGILADSKTGRLGGQVFNDTSNGMDGLITESSTATP